MSFTDPAAFAVSAHSLDALADVLLAVAVDSPPGALPLLVRVEDDPATPDGFLLGVKQLDEGPVAGALLGFVAPDPWLALGVAARGWALPPDSFGEADPATLSLPAPISARPDRLAIHMVTLVARDGREASRIRYGDGRLLTPESPCEGVVGECLRRALNLPTAPPPASLDELYARLWLTTVEQAAFASTRPLSWGQVAALHPAMALAGGGRAARDSLTEAAGLLGRTLSWADLRWEVITHPSVADGLASADAAWMDEGMFSRWMLARYQPLPALLAHLDSLLAPTTTRRIRRTLRELGLIEA